MKKKTKFQRLYKTTIQLSLFLFFIISCTKQEKIKFSEIQNLSTDSAILLINQDKNKIHWPQLCGQYLSELAQKKEDTAKSNPMYRYLYNRSIKESNPVGFEYYNRYVSFNFITKGEYDSALFYGYKALALKSKHDSIDPLHAYHLIGLAYFYKNQNSDSTNYYWTKGYKEAELNKDDDMIIHFGINLGTYYYNKGNTRNARSLFLKAKEVCIKIHRENGILINNIVNTFIDEQQYKEADKFWLQNSALLTRDISVYTGQLFLINRVNLLQLMERYDEAEKKLSLLHYDSVKPNLLLPYTRIYLTNKIHNNDFRFTEDTIWRNHILANAPYFAHNLEGHLTKIDPSKIGFFINKLVDISSDSVQFNEISYHQRAKICKFLAYHYKNKNPSTALNYYYQTIEYLNQAKLEEKKTQQKVIDELLQLENIDKVIKQQEEVIQNTRKTQQALLISLVLVCIILILGIWIMRNHLKIKNFEKSTLQMEQDSLKREKELNNRIVEYSKSIIDRNTKLKSELLTAVNTAPNAIKLRIIQVLNEFNISNINPEENPTIAKQLIKDKNNWNDQYPGFDNLNKTEQRVFVLTMESYRPKEIANVLGVSTQYVRNVKTRLKAKLNLQEDWSE